MVQVGDHVGRILGPDAQPDELGRNVGHAPGFLALLLVGGNSRDRGDALDPPEVGGPVDHLEAVVNLAGVFRRAVHPEAHEMAVPVDFPSRSIVGIHKRHVFLGQRVERVGGKAEVVDLVDFRMAGEPLGHLLAIPADQVHPRAQGS